MATLLATWIFGIAPPSMRTLANVSLIVLGVVIASFGEIKFDLIGFISMHIHHHLLPIAVLRMLTISYSPG